MKLFYRKYGQGKPMIILHGLFGMSDNWISIAKRLGLNYEVFLPDLRNHGQSTHSYEFNYKVMTEDLIEFINTHLAESLATGIFPIIIGHSMGGKVAMNFALDHSELVDKLIIADISPSVYTEHFEHLELINAMSAVDLNKIKSYSDIDKQLEKELITLRLRQFALKNILKTKEGEFKWKFGLEEIKQNLYLLLEGIDISKHYSKPTLFIKGGLSNYLKEDDFGVIKTIFPNSDIKTIPDATHWLHADKPERFVELVEEFCSDNLAGI